MKSSVCSDFKELRCRSAMTKYYIHIVALMLLTAVGGCVSVRGGNTQAPNPGSYHYQMGLSFLGERNYSSALFELTEAEKLDPDNPDVLYNLGLAFVGKKRPDLGEPKFLKAIILKPNFSVARNDLGVAYLEMKRWDSAIQQFKVVKDDLFYDNNENAIINLGLAYLGKGDYQSALNELQSAVSMNPRSPVIHLSLGRVWFALDKTEQAVVEYRKALDLFSDYGAAHYYLGQAQLKQNKLDAARVSFRETVRLVPESELGRTALGYLELIK